MGVQKRRANDIDIINYQEQRMVWVAGLQKGRGKNSGQRVRACKGEIRRVSFPSPRTTENPSPLPFRMQPCRPRKRWQTFKIMVRALLLRNYVNLLSASTRGWHPNYTWSRWGRCNQVTQIQKLSCFVVYSTVFLLSCIFLIFPFLTLTLHLIYLVYYRIVRWSELRGNQTKREQIWPIKSAPFWLWLFIPLISVLRWF